MLKIAIIIFILCEIILVMKCSEEDVDVVTESDNENETSRYYTAAVLELYLEGGGGDDEFSDPQQIVDANLKKYIRLINEAKEHDVDILVFPEATLNYNGISTREDLIKFAIELPEEMSDDEDGCDYTSNFILNELSEAVQNVSMYVLVNIVERCNETDALFNTNIVFHRDGCIVSRYRKFNLFIEPNMNVTEEPEMALFQADFGVTFGHFICFDILYKSPALEMISNLNISHILYPSMWYSEMPFLTSTQVQQNYAYRNNIVLLSSGVNAPSDSNSGSGIFVGKHGEVMSIVSIYRNESKMIVARVPKDVNDSEYHPEKPAIKPHTSIELDKLKLYSHIPKSALTYPLSEGSIIHESGLECEFSIDFTRLHDEEENAEDESFGYGYRLIAFNGIRNYANISNGGEIYCAIVACLNESDPLTCGRKFESSENLVPSVDFHSIKIKATLHESDSSNYLVMPTSLDFSIKPLPTDEFEFTIQEEDDSDVKAYEIEAINELSEILTFGIYGRNFNKDGKYQLDEEDEKTEVENYVDSEIFVSTLKADDDEFMEMISEVQEHKTKENIRGHGDPNMYITVAIYVPLMIVLCIIAAILVYRRLQEPYEHPLIIMRRKSEMPQLA